MTSIDFTLPLKATGMMPPVVADSEDDSDQDLLASSQVAADEVHSRPVSTNMDGATDGTNGTSDAKSTGSTDLLRRQILAANEGLMATARSEPTASKPAVSSPALQQARKRRHTTGPGSEPAGSPSVKRAKRQQTYRSRRRTIADQDDNDDVSAAENLQTSQASRFSEHSGARSSAELPGGSIQNAFVNHEPAVMFRESGSTIEDTLSAQERYLEQAGLIKDHLATSRSGGEVRGSTGEKLSSSLAWLPASAQTPGGGDENGGCGDVTDDDSAINHEMGVRDADRSTQQRPNLERDGREEAAAAKDHETIQRGTTAVVVPSTGSQASPIVKIPSIERAAARDSTATANVETAKESRRRKSEPTKPDSEPFNSDDKAIGLPKERYVPRPSRRRATAIVEEPIDYALIPEKAAKVKRTRTTAIAGTGMTLLIRDTDDTIQGLDSKKATDNANVDDEQSSAEQNPRSDVNKDTAHSGTEDLSKKQNELESLPKSSQPDSSPSIADKPKDNDEMFVKPALPTPKPKSSTKTRRSHTTIFEDHVEFIGSQRSSPSLSQQQAKRKSALQSASKIGQGATQKKERDIVVHDDDDDEDELTKDNDVDEEPSPPKRRGRGRPLKATPKAYTKSKSAETVVEDSDDDAEVRSETDEAPKKAKRGPPSRTKAITQAKLAASDKENEPTDPTEAGQSPRRITEAVANTVVQSVERAPTSLPAAQKIATPSPEKEPEKQPEKPTPAAQKITRPDPNSHSPIKSSSAVPHRVGLSRRHRIPSLLRTMKPPKR